MNNYSTTLDDLLSDTLKENKRQKKVDKNLDEALIKIPKLFKKCNLIYANCLINKTNIRVLIDSGAQISIIPLYIAKKIGIEDLIDYEINTNIIGVGNNNIDTIGKISLIDIYFQISKNVNELNLIQINGSFSVIDDDDSEPIFGLDLLINNNAIVDFGNRHMIIQGLHIDLI